jgi:hypothetical protein
MEFLEEVYGYIDPETMGNELFCYIYHYWISTFIHVSVHLFIYETVSIDELCNIEFNIVYLLLSI